MTDPCNEVGECLNNEDDLNTRILASIASLGLLDKSNDVDSLLKFRKDASVLFKLLLKKIDITTNLEMEHRKKSEHLLEKLRDAEQNFAFEKQILIEKMANMKDGYQSIIVEKNHSIEEYKSKIASLDSMTVKNVSSMAQLQNKIQLMELSQKVSSLPSSGSYIADLEAQNEYLREELALRDREIHDITFQRDVELYTLCNIVRDILAASSSK